MPRLGGTLTATFLSLSGARPDLATLGAVGAPLTVAIVVLTARSRLPLVARID